MSSGQEMSKQGSWWVKKHSLDVGLPRRQHSGGRRPNPSHASTWPIPAPVPSRAPLVEREELSAYGGLDPHCLRNPRHTAACAPCSTYVDSERVCRAERVCRTRVQSLSSATAPGAKAGVREVREESHVPARVQHPRFARPPGQLIRGT